MTLSADPRLLATFDADTGNWRITEGAHRVALGKSATDLVSRAEAELAGRTFGDRQASSKEAVARN